MLISHVLVGASLSEPHTSRTALRGCVCIRPCLQPHTVNFKCTCKYFPKIEYPRALSMHGMTMLGNCQSAALATVAEAAQV